MTESLKNKYHLFDLLQIAFILTDAHSKILFANRYTERLFGYSKEEIEGERVRILFLEEDLTYFLPNILYVSLYQNGFEGEALLKQKNGVRIFVHLNTSTFKEDGEDIIVFSFQEIQRLKKLERERLDMDHWVSLGMMVQEIAHQIRNPIAAIGGLTQRLLNMPIPSLKGKSYFQRILHESEKLGAILHRVEEYVLIPKPVYKGEKIQEIVESTLQTFSDEAIDKGISINLETGALAGEGDFFIDKKLLGKALFYILENSMEAVTRLPKKSKRREIHISLFGDQEEIRISLYDKGEGIPKKNLDLIFDPFFSTRPDHVGLGLTFVKRVIKDLGGRILVQSRFGKGMTVTLTFPKDRRRKVRQEVILS